MTAQMKPVEDLILRPERSSRPAPWWRRAIALILKTLIPLAILFVAAKIAWALYLTAPVAEREARPRVPRLVEVVEVMPATRGPLIEAWGEVVAARTLVVRPEVGGTIVALSDRLTPGGLVLAGEELIRLDDREQRFAVIQAEAEIHQIQARISIEDGQQARARRDLERLPGKLTESQRHLVLRAPQMAQLQAELAAAEAERDRALVELSHTVIRAPFDALVIEEQVALGTMLSAGSAPATLIAADRFHVVVAVPVSALDWINPKSGQVLRLTQPGIWPEGSFREGTVEFLTAGLSATGRMAELVVSIDDPLARKPENRGKPRLLLGSFLRAIGEGRVVENAVALDRAYLHDQDTVWLMTPEGRLEVRTVTIAWRGAETVLIGAGLAAGDRVITTPLAVVAPGMAVRLAGNAGEGAQQ
ncbi:MAG: efflux RND transporter periplasmic adaptor subunit [Proteobacteria bacterium]|nr:efflux RND transporter periplasmic adaptor subunit [Pseudomonadota bacterium]MCH8952588.1 efflux RND transporter periplasmic adaptor subunit [Pseudomonadota bacterium]